MINEAQREEDDREDTYDDGEIDLSRPIIDPYFYGYDYDD